VGRFLLKSVLDGHPIGGGLGTFVFEFLCNHESRAFDATRPHYALQLLSNVDDILACAWRRMLDEPRDDELSALTMDAFDDSLPDEPLTRANVASSVVAGCKRKLLVDRRASLQALCDGFTFNGKLDLRLQLAQHRLADVALLLQGRVALSVDDLLGCFDWSTPHSSPAVGYLHELLRDGVLNLARRRLLLRWCTGLNALPADGLKQQITLRLADGDGNVDGRLPTVRTCYYEVHLPRYTSKAVLHERLDKVLVDFESGGGFGME